jgi:hypothetical protein
MAKTGAEWPVFVSEILDFFHKGNYIKINARLAKIHVTGGFRVTFLLTESLKQFNTFKNSG